MPLPRLRWAADCPCAVHRSGSPFFRLVLYLGPVPDPTVFCQDHGQSGKRPDCCCKQGFAESTSRIILRKCHGRLEKAGMISMAWRASVRLNDWRAEPLTLDREGEKQQPLPKISLVRPSPRPSSALPSPVA